MTVKILDFQKNEWSNWLLADTRGTTLTDFSSFLGWRLKGDSNVTYDPVEKGYFVAYNKTIMPFEGTVTLAKSSKSPADLQKVLDTLEALRTSTETFSIVTPLREYKNLNLLSYEYKFEENGATSQLIVDLALIEVREVESSYSDVVVSSGGGAITTSDAENPSDTSTQNTGSKNTEEGNEELTSTLYDIGAIVKSW